MKKNIGTIDRGVRLCVGVACFIGAYYIGGALSIVAVLLGAFCVYEALVSWCAFYMLIGKNTCPLE